MVGLRRFRNALWSVSAGLVMVAVLWSAIVALVAHNRNELRAAAETDAGNMARVFAEHTRRTVTMIDLALQDYRDYHRARPDAPPQEGWRDTYLKEGGVFQWAIINAQGMMIHSNLAPVTAPVDLSDREHFRVHRDSGRDELFISRPVLGRVSQRWSIQFTRRLSRPDGSFGGVVVLSVEPGYFIANFEAIDTGAHGVTLLAGMDRIVRARFSRQADGDKGLGDTLPADYPFFDPAQPVGMTPVVSFLDGVNRYSGWRHVKSFPLVVAVQIAEQDVLAQAAAVERTLGAIGVLGSLGMLAAAVAIGQLLDRREEARRLLERQAKELQLANEEVERLAYVAAHDLQEPLRAITSYSQLVTMSYAATIDDEGRAWLDEVAGAAARMKALLRDIQVYLAEKSLPLPTKPTSADVAMKEALAKLAPVFHAVKPKLDVDALPSVMADRRRLTEIFVVLLGNAVEYRAPDRPPCIGVRTRRENGYDVIAVTDNGIGIEPQYHERIFEVFRRLHSRADHPGTGMGLAIVRKMVQRLGGRIEVASTPGVGSTFTVYLPIQPTGTNDEQQERRALHHSSGGGRSRRRDAGEAGDQAGAGAL